MTTKPTQTIKLDIELSETQALQMVKDIFSVYPNVAKEFKTVKTSKATTKKETHVEKTSDETTQTEGVIKGTVCSAWKGRTRFFMNGREAIDEVIARAKLDGHEIDTTIRKSSEYGESVEQISIAFTNGRGMQLLVPTKLEEWAKSIMAVKK